LLRILGATIQIGTVMERMPQQLVDVQATNTLNSTLRADQAIMLAL
jgi:hypothetical protein